ncbi:MAG: sigma-54 interaction domain-containing protein [Bacillota bacterium]
MKPLVLVTLDKVTQKKIKTQLYSLVDEKIKVTGYTLEDDEAQKIEGKVVLISCTSIVADVFKKFRLDKEAHIIVARRSIDKAGIEQLLRVKPGTRATVIVGHPAASAVTIEAIRRLGISYIDLINEQDFYSGDDQVDIIITPGKMNRIKSDIPLININILNLDVTTVVEVLMALNLYDKYQSQVSHSYTSPIIELSQDLQHALTEISNMKNQLEALVNASHDGVVLVNKELEVLAINDAACSMFKLKKGQTIGTCYSEGAGFPCDWSHILNNNVIKHAENSLIIGVTPVCTSDIEIGRVVTFRDVTEIQRLEQIVRKKSSERGHVAHYSFKDIVGESPEMTATKNIAAQIASTEGTILIYGESGVGKELFAQAIHRNSKRKKGPFVAINFSALPDNLVESELFGYEEGAFTGARKGGKPGFFELAHGGTIFLDEIGDANPYIQTRLLRVLQEKEVMRVGSTKVIPVDVRVIAASNKYLLDLVKNNRFREDLYYRLNVLPLSIPPLRSRGNDIKLIFEQLCKQKGVAFELTSQAWELLLNHCWPGNIRELKNLIDYLDCTRSYNEVIDINDFPMHLIESVNSCPIPVAVNSNPAAVNVPSQSEEVENLLKIEEPTKVQKIELLKKIYLNQQKGINSGRRSLTNAFPGITEARLRLVLKELAGQDLIEMNRGRKGTLLTKKGIEAINNGMI